MAEQRIAALATDPAEARLSTTLSRHEDDTRSDDEKTDVKIVTTDNKLANEISWQIDDIPLKYRLMAFCFVVFFSTGAAFAEMTLGPLKSTLVKELKLTSETCRYKADLRRAIRDHFNCLELGQHCAPHHRWRSDGLLWRLLRGSHCILPHSYRFSHRCLRMSTNILTDNSRQTQANTDC